MTSARLSILPAVILAVIVALAAAAPARGEQAMVKRPDSNFIPCTACHDPAASKGTGHGTKARAPLIVPVESSGATKVRCSACHAAGTSRTAPSLTPASPRPI